MGTELLLLDSELIMLGVLLALSFAWAEDRLLTYEDAMRAAAAQNPSLRQAELALATSDSQVRTAMGRWDPTLNVSAGYDRNLSLQFQPPFPDPFRSVSNSWNLGATVAGTAPTGTSASVDMRMFSSENRIEAENGSFEQSYFQPAFTLNVGQEILRGFRMKYNLQSVRQAHEASTQAELQAVVARQQALAETARAYWAWLYAVQSAQIASQSVKTAEESLRVGVARVGAGQLAPIEQTRLETALVEARMVVLDATNSVAQAADALLLLMGEAPGQPITPATMAGDAPLLDLEEGAAIEAALAGNPDLAVVRASIEASRLAIADAKHATLPTLTANANAGFRGGDAESWARAYQFLGGFPQLGVSASFAVPLGNRAASGGVQTASARLAQEDARLRQQEASVVSQVLTQVRTLESAKQRVELMDARVRLHEQTLASQEALYAGGRVLLQDLLAQRVEVDRARVEAAKARTDARLAEVDLLRLGGKL
jgi:outer membrane protein TolC